MPVMFFMMIVVFVYEDDNGLDDDGDFFCTVSTIIWKMMCINILL